MGGLFLSELAFQRRVEQQEHGHYPGDQHDGPEHRRDVVPAEDEDLPRWKQPKQALGEAHVPVRLGPCRDLRGDVGSVVPDRVDLEETGHDAQHADIGDEEPGRLERERRQDADPDDVALRLAGAGELGVLLVPDQAQVHADQRRQDPRNEQHVQDVETRIDHTGTWILATPQQPVQPGADHRDGQHDPGSNPQASAREQVVGQRVADEAFQDAKN